MTNGVLEKILRDELTRDLEQLGTVAADGDDASVLSIARHDMPRLVAALMALVDQHKPDADGRCRECRRGWWKRLPGPCRMLLAVRLAWTLNGPKPQEPKARVCSAWRPGRASR
ncbi:hypothetical protein [Lentzea sp. NPDC004782]|uniref:hypothetical protein n=1 Tax=Lentzea sp. NPDC004782 TaxID=3154458 RepID=UPI00339E4340